MAEMTERDQAYQVLYDMVIETGEQVGLLFSNMEEIEKIDYDAHKLYIKIQERFLTALEDIADSCQEQGLDTNSIDDWVLIDDLKLQVPVYAEQQARMGEANYTKPRFKRTYATAERGLQGMGNLKYWDDYCKKYLAKIEKFPKTRPEVIMVQSIAEAIADYKKDVCIQIKTYLSALPDFLAKCTETVKAKGLGLAGDFVNSMKGLFDDRSVELSDKVYKELSKEAVRMGMDADSAANVIIHKYIQNPNPSQQSSNVEPTPVEAVSPLQTRQSSNVEPTPVEADSLRQSTFTRTVSPLQPRQSNATVAKTSTSDDVDMQEYTYDVDTATVMAGAYNDVTTTPVSEGSVTEEVLNELDALVAQLHDE